MEQRTNEWFSARLGRVTASRVSDVIAKTKTGYSASRANYMAELIVERLTGAPTESYQNSAMIWGTNTEPLARAAYEVREGALVEEVGFVPHPTIEAAGCSPDGLVGEDGLIEIKCPNTATHIEYLLDGNAPSKYIPQMQWQMACTGSQWVDFVSFDPRMPEDMQYAVYRVNRDNELIEKLEQEVEKFLAELDDKVEALKKRTQITY
jgi:putative phage-type endonuclease